MGLLLLQAAGIGLLMLPGCVVTAAECTCDSFCAGSCAPFCNSHSGASCPSLPMPPALVQNLTLYRFTPRSIKHTIADTNTGDIDGDLGFFIARRALTARCAVEPRNLQCFLAPWPEIVFARWEIEIDQGFGPYLACNPAYGSPNASGPETWDLNRFMCSQTCVLPPFCGNLPKHNDSAGGDGQTTCFCGRSNRTCGIMSFGAPRAVATVTSPVLALGHGPDRLEYLWGEADAGPGWSRPSTATAGAQLRHAPSGLCVDARGESGALGVDGDQVLVAPCAPEPVPVAQRWSIAPNGNLHMAGPGGLCLAVKYFDGPGVVLYDCSKGENEEFVFGSNGTLCSKGDAGHAPRCLTVKSGSPGSGGEKGSPVPAVCNFGGTKLTTGSCLAGESTGVWRGASMLDVAAECCAACDPVACTGWAVRRGNATGQATLGATGEYTCETFVGSLTATVGEAGCMASARRDPLPGGSWNWHTMGVSGGAWFSTPKPGECINGHRPGDGSGCTWRVVAAPSFVESECVNSRLDAAVMKAYPACFANCTVATADPGITDLTDNSAPHSECFFRCYWLALNDNDAAATNIWKTAIKPAFLAAWEQPGGCPSAQ